MHRLFFVLISLFTANSFAAEVSDLYQSHFPVSSQSEQERRLVAPEVLRQVVLKVVGDRAALDIVDVSPILAQTEKLIQQYQYRRVNTISDDLTQPDKLEVLLKFNEDSLNKSLTNLGLPIWSNSRPEVLLWLAVDDGNSRHILGAEEIDGDIPAAIMKATERRGLPMLMPLMDLQDQNQVQFADLWAGFPEAVLQASQRYAAQVILMARVSISDNGALQVRWQSHVNDESDQWQSRGGMQRALNDGIDELTDRLARRFTQVVTSQYDQEYSLQISNVNDYSDYSRAINYLKNLQYVSDVKLVSLETDKLEVTIGLKGEIAVFNRTLAIDHVLLADNSYNPFNVMRYRLLP
ncbi:MAG: DUF2066 domain-containing protein [Piscirickettsiaceae bacterium]|nr:DUF2066 domain-containing protein [Piscirickettsiaceae bacterium]